MRKILIGSVVAASVLASNALAANIAVDNTGQYLVSGQYYAMSGYKTKLRLVNSDLANSILLRGAIKEYISSEEIDFTVTLSPGDVWEGWLTYENGKAILRSTDDSNYVKTGTNLEDAEIYKGVDMSAQNNAAKPLVPRDFTKGYVEFYPIAQVNHANVNGVAAKILKPVLSAHVEGLAGLGADCTGLSANDCAVARERAAVTYANTHGEIVKVGNEAVGGFATIYADAKDAAMTLPMMTIENIDGIGGNVLNLTKQVVVGSAMRPGNDTRLSAYFTPNAVRDIRNILWLNSVTVPFEVKGYDQDVKYAWIFDRRRRTTGDDIIQTRSYDLNVRDMLENRPGIKNVGSTISPWRPDAPTHASTGGEMGFTAIGRRDTETIKAVLQDYTTLKDLGQEIYDDGMVKITNYRDTTTGAEFNPYDIDINLASVVSYMTATDVGDGKLSYNWIYPIVERDNDISNGGIGTSYRTDPTTIP